MVSFTQSPTYHMHTHVLVVLTRGCRVSWHFDRTSDRPTVLRTDLPPTPRGNGGREGAAAALDFFFSPVVCPCDTAGGNFDSALMNIITALVTLP